MLPRAGQGLPPAVEGLQRVGVALSELRRRPGDRVVAADHLDALDAAEQWLLGRRADLLEATARRARNLAADAAQLAHGTTLDVVAMLAELRAVRGLVLTLAAIDGDADASRAA